PWWVLAGGAAVAAVAAPSTEWTAVAVVSFVIASVIGAQRIASPVARSAAAGGVVLVLLHLEIGGFHGSSALVAAIVAGTIAISGVMRRRHLVRRTTKRVILAMAVAVGVAIIGVGVAAAFSYGDVRDGERALRNAVSALSDGDVQTASEQLSVSREYLGSASDSFSRPWAKLSHAVPLLGQHVDVVSTSLNEAEVLADTASTAVAQVNIDSLQIVNGVVDLNAIELLSVPVTDVSKALVRTSSELTDARSDWLAGPLGDRFDEIRSEIDDLQDQAVKGLAAIDVAPAMLGKDGPRTYFMAFTTPAEARGLGGFMGTWAELKADGGRMEVVRTGSTIDLTRGMSSPRPILTGPEDYLNRYGKFGAGGGDVPVAIDFWSNYTLSPDFPDIAEVAAQLYPASGGTEIDGMIALDVETIARFLDLTGPIQVEGPDGTIRLTDTNAVDYLLRGQYADIADDDVRDEILEELTTTLIQDIFGGSLPGPRVLATTLGPSISSGRLVMWSLHEDDQPALETIGIAGELPPPSPDGLAVVSNNAGANKLDAYLKRSIAYDAVVHEATGELRATATIRLANDAPEGLPPDAGGNPVGLPDGTNRMYLSIYSPWGFTSAEVNGEPRGMNAQQELGWNVYSTTVDIPRGEEIEVKLDLAGVVEDVDNYGFTLRSQPMTFPDVARIDVRDTTGATWVSSHKIRSGVEEMWRDRDTGS
ncbi:DUF4012 domain-containing protein, partial [Ilumatobacter sp.]|uniref:DUF4012 domain-containing protein n=1 Tax=Ilumatobacter sp. TaxID=1967498 RepID=UPI003C5E3910